MILSVLKGKHNGITSLLYAISRQIMTATQILPDGYEALKLKVSPETLGACGAS